jgi:hypothetical protein
MEKINMMAAQLEQFQRMMGANSNPEIDKKLAEVKAM